MPDSHARLARRRIVAVGTTLALAVAAPAALAQAPRTVDITALANGLVTDLCPAFVDQIAGKPGLAAMLRSRPVRTEAVCACTEREFRSDRRLQSIFRQDYRALKEQMKSENLRAYFVMRVMQASMACLAEEFAEILDQNDPAQ